MFVDCGDLLKASQVFRRLICQNEHSWSFLILGYCLEGNLQHALKLYDEMKKTNIKPSSFTFVGLLNACVANRNLEVGRSVHEEIKEKGFAEDVLVGNSLIDMYMKCGFLNEAEKVFEGLPVQDVVSWTALLAGYVEFDLSQEALTFYHKMQSKAISSNAVTMALAMKASRIVCDTDQGRIIHSEAVKKGYEGDLTLSNSILSLYAKCSCVDDAHYVFDKLPDRDVVSWNTMIVAHTEHGNFQEALECYEQMQIAKIVPDSWTMSSMLKVCASLGALEQGKELHNKSLQLGLADNVSVVNSLIDFYGRCGWMPESRMVFEKLVNKDVISWTALIAGYAEHGQVDEALDNFMKMQENGFAPNAVTYSCALKACCASGVHDGARTLHMDVVKMGLDSEETVINTLINVYATFGSLIDAEAVFERMPARCVVSWTALIGGYVDCGYNIDALKYFEKMQAGQISPNFVTYAYILKACGSIGAVEKGREFHLEIAWDGFESDPSVGSALINMYAQCGSLSEACEVFNDLLTRDITVWSSMMKAYALNHQGYDAVHCFKDMLQQGLKPDVVTFTCLLTACSHAGLIQEGLEYFKLMREKYGFAPTNEHYSCIVDLLGRSGELLEAEKFIETFTVTQEDAWAALLTACKTHGDVDLGMRCFEQLMQKDPEDAAWYTLMTDILTGAGRWEDALKIETFRKHVEAKKMPATAWIEIDRQVHRFMVGDEQNEDILAAVRALNLRLKDEGHVPNLNLDVRPVSDHKKEEALCEHAEKLAIAFGLLNTPQGTSLRVSKNLRMCADCHNASKIISRMERREIILRDDCCMHHFIDGSCVCGDMF
ncbi:hypothetical protein KP509_04G036800 [Ceratopteris richardii]|nr:hypothetical protein KP509_04G036800 [Ceratopteris richardii]